MLRLIEVIVNTILLAMRTRSLRSLFGNVISKGLQLNGDARIIDSRVQGSVSIGNKVTVRGAHLVGRISIGDYSYLSGPGIAIFSAVNAVTIGKFCSIARGVQIQEYNHRFDGLSTAFLSKKLSGKKRSIRDEVVSRGPVVLGNDVWVGANAIILSGVSVGSGAVIAAGSVVTKDIPAYSIVAGVPARVVKFRFSEAKAREIDSLKWWDRSPSEIALLREEYE